MSHRVYYGDDEPVSLLRAYELVIVVPVHASGKYLSRIFQFRDHGLQHMRPESICVILLAGTEGVPASAAAGWQCDLYIVAGKSHEAFSKLSEFLLRLPVKALRMTEWVMKVDDDSITDVEGLLRNLRASGQKIPRYLCSGYLFQEESGISRFLGKCGAKLKGFGHEWEACALNRMALAQISRSKRARAFLSRMSRRSVGNGDWPWAVAASLAGVEPEPAGFMTSWADVVNFSVLGGRYCHLHYLSSEAKIWDTVLELIRSRTAKGKYSKPPQCPAEDILKEFVHGGFVGSPRVSGLHGKVYSMQISDDRTLSRQLELRAGGSMNFQTGVDACSWRVSGGILFFFDINGEPSYVFAGNPAGGFKGICADDPNLTVVLTEATSNFVSESFGQNEPYSRADTRDELQLYRLIAGKYGAGGIVSVCPRGALAAGELRKWSKAPCFSFTEPGAALARKYPACSVLYYEDMAYADDHRFRWAADNLFGHTRYLVLQSAPGLYSMGRSPHAHRFVKERIALLADKGYRYLEEDTLLLRSVVGRTAAFRRTGLVLIKENKP